MADLNPFRPAKRESYQDQLDLSGPSSASTERLMQQEDLLVDVDDLDAEKQPRFLESASAPPTSGTIGPKTTPVVTGTADSTRAVGTNQPVDGSSTLSSRLCAFLSVDYYRPYFDVSSNTVLERMKSAVSPQKNDMFESTSDSPPDLYGAVWISLTLIFLIGATSNLNAYYAHNKKEPWERDYRLLSFASTLIFLYTFAVPVVIWGLSIYFGVEPRPSLLKLIGLYGYTMVIFIPASILCIIPISLVQWLVVLIAGGVSGVVLVRNIFTLIGHNYTQVSQDTESLTPTTEEGSGPRKNAYLLLAATVVQHSIFSLMLKLFFFQGADLRST